MSVGWLASLVAVKRTSSGQHFACPHHQSIMLWLMVGFLSVTYTAFKVLISRMHTGGSEAHKLVGSAHLAHKYHQRVLLTYVQLRMQATQSRWFTHVLLRMQVTQSLDSQSRMHVPLGMPSLDSQSRTVTLCTFHSGCKPLKRVLLTHVQLRMQATRSLRTHAHNEGWFTHVQLRMQVTQSLDSQSRMHVRLGMPSLDSQSRTVTLCTLHT